MNGFGFGFSAALGTLLNQKLWYGIQINEAINSTEAVRIAGDGQMSLHATLPVHNLLKACVINADKTVNYYLDPTDWSKKLNGTASNLTGSDGNVMIHLSQDCYLLKTKVGDLIEKRISLYPLPGYTKIEKQFFSAYEGNLSGGKLRSVSGVLPTTSRSLTQFRADARANGGGYEQQYFAEYDFLIDLFTIEFATTNFQKPVDNTLTAEGYKKGGLGNGVTTAVSAEWSAYNGSNPFITCGASNILASGTGQVSVTINNFGGAGVNRTFTVPRYRGIENWFGHVWKWIDGITINHLSDRREVYVFDNPAQFADATSVNARLLGLMPLTEGYIRRTIGATFLPTTVGSGASSTTNYADYFYAPALSSGWRALISGGAAYYGASAGAFYAYTSYVASNAYAYLGGRLCAK